MSDDKKMTVSNDRMDVFLDTIADQAWEVMKERSEDMLKAWRENIEEAQANDKNFPPLKLSIGAVVDLDAGTIETTVRFTAIYQSSVKASLDDPNQPELPPFQVGKKSKN